MQSEQQRSPEQTLVVMITLAQCGGLTLAGHQSPPELLCHPSPQLDKAEKM